MLHSADSAATTDESLYADYKLGNDDAFTALVYRHSPALYSFLMVNLDIRYRGDMNDLIQTVLIDLSQKTPIFEDGSLLKWLLMVAKKDMVDHFRRKKAKKRHTGVYDAVVREDDAYHNGLLFHELTAVEVSESLHEMIAHLPEIERQIIQRLLCSDQRTQGWVARCFDLSPKEYRTHYQAALRHLKTMMVSGEYPAVPPKLYQLTPPVKVRAALPLATLEYLPEVLAVA